MCVLLMEIFTVSGMQGGQICKNTYLLSVVVIENWSGKNLILIYILYCIEPYQD